GDLAAAGGGQIHRAFGVRVPVRLVPEDDLGARGGRERQRQESCDREHFRVTNGHGVPRGLGVRSCRRAAGKGGGADGPGRYYARLQRRKRNLREIRQNNKSVVILVYTYNLRSYYVSQRIALTCWYLITSVPRRDARPAAHQAFRRSS